MNEKHTKSFLIIEDDDDYADLIRLRLSEEKGFPFKLHRVATLTAALGYLSQHEVGFILLDLSLPDSRGLDTLIRLRAMVSNIPIVVLSGLDDESIALEAVRRGAQDYLIKDQADAKVLSRVIRYSVERHQMQEELQNLALIDQLTGLYNRRGFFVVGEQQVKLASRASRDFLLVLADVDNLKQINDQFGHAEGDRVLANIAEVLRTTFRKSDILARLGGDEFGVLAIEASKNHIAILSDRLQMNLEKQASQLKTRYPFSLSFGVAHFNPQSPETLDQLMVSADRALYEDKRKKKSVT